MPMIHTSRWNEPPWEPRCGSESCREQGYCLCETDPTPLAPMNYRVLVKECKRETDEIEILLENVDENDVYIFMEDKIVEADDSEDS